MASTSSSAIALAGLHRFATAARLAVDPDTDLDFVVAKLEERRAFCGRGAGGERNPHCASDESIDVVANLDEFGEVGSLLGRRARSFDDEEVAFHPAPAHRVRGVLHRNVVVDDHRGDFNSIGRRQLGRHLEGGAVAGVVVDDVEDALVGVEELRGLVDELDGRTRKHVARAGAVEHPLADDHRMGRFVSRARALDDRDLVGPRHVRPVDEVVLRLVLEGAATGQLDPRQELRYELPRVP